MRRRGTRMGLKNRRTGLKKRRRPPPANVAGIAMERNATTAAPPKR